MGYGETLKNPGANDFPEGRRSYEGSIKQVKGNLRWSLKFLSPEEIIELLVQVQVTPNDVQEIKSRIEYYDSQIEKLQKKLELLEQGDSVSNNTEANNYDRRK